MKFALLGLMVCTLAVSGCSSKPIKTAESGKPELREMILFPPPNASDPLMEGWYLDIEPIMKAEKLSRLQAVELQNRMRDYLADPKASIQESYDKALAELRRGEVESGWAPVTFGSPGDFVLVVELAQAVSPLGPEFFSRVRKNPHCKALVVFTSEEDALAIQALKKSRVKFDGVFTRNHMVMRKNSPNLGKDLRIIDPTLEHVVALDADAQRVQPGELLRISTFGFSGGTRAIQDEIEESVHAAGVLKIPFARAFKPYSYQGEAEFRALVQSLGSRKKALREARGEIQKGS